MGHWLETRPGMGGAVNLYSVGVIKDCLSCSSCSDSLERVMEDMVHESIKIGD